MGTSAACCHWAAELLLSNCTAATNSALSASELKNCADMMVKKPRFIGYGRASAGLRQSVLFEVSKRCRVIARPQAVKIQPFIGHCHRIMPRPIRATIDNHALRHNLAQIRAIAPNARVWAVVKANAYGHGIERTFDGDARRRRICPA